MSGSWCAKVMFIEPGDNEVYVVNGVEIPDQVSFAGESVPWTSLM